MPFSLDDNPIACHGRCQMGFKCPYSVISSRALSHAQHVACLGYEMTVQVTDRDAAKDESEIDICVEVRRYIVAICSRQVFGALLGPIDYISYLFDLF